MGVAALMLMAACSGDGATTDFAIPFERFELANGLDVILHVDRSDPIAAVVMTFHVGSSREAEGKTGFAHLLEHLFFLDSENLGPGGLDRLMTRVGSATNGTTSRDGTNYYEVVPIDGLQKTLWAESDKLGFFINTVTESVVAKEKQVVKNEKRQGVDNQPYGHMNYVLDRATYPDGHPYQWQVIGSLEDLDGAELADILDFHGQWYGPNNATLVVAGDIDVAQTRAWIETYFDEIQAVPLPPTVSPPAVALTGSKYLVHEDNYAQLPMLSVAWPTVPLYHPDSYALDVLGDLLTDGKSTPFYQVIVQEEALAPAASAGHQAFEHAGRFSLSVRAFAGTDLDDVQSATDAAFARFEAQGVPATELERVTAGYERNFYSGVSSVIGKAFRLAQFNIFADDPGYVAEDLNQTLGVTADDVRRVYNTYIKDRPFVAASFVPRGAGDLALDGSQPADVVVEPILLGAEVEVATVTRGEALTPSSIDRSVEPPFGAASSRSMPDVWRTTLANGVEVLGIQDDDVPLVQFRLGIEGGYLLEDPAAPSGVANLLAETMTQGTARRTPEELENALDRLGASVTVSSGSQSFAISGTALVRNYTATMALVEEMLLEPRFDEGEIELARFRVQNGLRQRASNPVAAAADAFNALLYGDHLLASDSVGTIESVGAIDVAALREYYDRALTPALAAFHVAGRVSEPQVIASLAGIASRWLGESVPLPAPPSWDPARAGLYFLDVPDASQSVLRIGYLALAESDDAYYPATIMNFRLGGGGFASDLMQVLREQLGYTYGITSRFTGTGLPGPFQIASSVRSNVTLEALQTIKDIVDAHGPEFDDADLDATQSFLLRANAGAFESLGAKLGLLGDMSLYGFAADYVLQREETVRAMTVDGIKRLATEYLASDRMVWLVVGDARTQLERLVALDLGPVVTLDRVER